MLKFFEQYYVIIVWCGMELIIIQTMYLCIVVLKRCIIIILIVT